ncbi:hypothetical protein [Streptomyces sp. TS71-3]|uniref:hypothetical protein n=1 Tax=Streptomyces sp. TS71-3 TaxID=2733862 RepID=UPI001AFD5521|nr:hypothetical protein [Streptomyces sp. TS71-3]GHJ37030.1 hypothetical protein Sm713_26390 [Streptomyces sp. TS71-3]
MKRLRRTRLLALGVMALLFGLIASPTAQAAPAKTAAAAAATDCAGSWDGKTYWAKSPSGANGGGYARTYWDSSTKRNCAKFWSSPYDGLASHITLYLYSEDSDYAADPPQEHPANYHYYAGPLYTWFDATGQCIHLGGSLVRGGVTYRLSTGDIRCG